MSNLKIYIMKHFLLLLVPLFLIVFSCNDENDFESEIISISEVEKSNTIDFELEFLPYPSGHVKTNTISILESGGNLDGFVTIQHNKLNHSFFGDIDKDQSNFDVYKSTTGNSENTTKIKFSGVISFDNGDSIHYNGELRISLKSIYKGVFNIYGGTGHFTKVKGTIKIENESINSKEESVVLKGNGNIYF